MRVGIGYDSHRFDESRPLILGGIAFPGEPGLAGHSDGDAVCHAITDAILGAAGIGDIGVLFPDTDPANAGADSIDMLAKAVAEVRRAGFAVQNVDVTVVAERPKIGPRRIEMVERLAAVLGDAVAVSVKGKTNEGMGWVGRGEGLAVMAVSSLGPDRA
jgi:2-C-methyl-D-erythritol 2,4-cyclodiphosphate synthase